MLRILNVSIPAQIKENSHEQIDESIKYEYKSVYYIAYTDLLRPEATARWLAMPVHQPCLGRIGDVKLCYDIWLHFAVACMMSIGG
jgi:hypothetical protein